MNAIKQSAVGWCVTGLLCLGLLCLTPSSFLAAPTADFTSPVTIFKPITLTLRTGSILSFGEFIQQSTAGVVKIFPFSCELDTTVTTVTLVDNTAVSCAIWDVTGEPLKSHSRLGGDPTATLTLVGGTETMTVDLVPWNLSTGFDADGNLVIGVSGILSVGANQAPGTYTGTFNVVVNYL